MCVCESAIDYYLMEPDQSQNKSSDMTAKRETYEVFRYKVVYPGGTFLRISPATTAEKTGSILEFGTIFDATKSLFLDGINYAKLSDGSGWVFERKNDVQILELLQIIRVPCKSIIKGNSTEESTPSKSVPVIAIPHQSLSALVGNRAGVAESAPNSPHEERLESHNSLHNRGSLPTQRQQAKVENRLWRDVRARCGVCGTFEEFLQLVATVKISIEGMPSQHEQRVLDSITLIASITGQCSAHVVRQGKDLVGVGACLWVLVHMGSRVSHTMALIVESANQIFESASSMKKANLLRYVDLTFIYYDIEQRASAFSKMTLTLLCPHFLSSVVLEVGTRTKSHAADLARQVDILPDDIRNFLQRWIIVQVSNRIRRSKQLIWILSYSRTLLCPLSFICHSLVMYLYVQYARLSLNYVHKSSPLSHSRK